MKKDFISTPFFQPGHSELVGIEEPGAVSPFIPAPRLAYDWGRRKNTPFAVSVESFHNFGTDGAALDLSQSGTAPTREGNKPGHNYGGAGVMITPVGSSPYLQDDGDPMTWVCGFLPDLVASCYMADARDVTTGKGMWLLFANTTEIYFGWQAAGTYCQIAAPNIFDGNAHIVFGRTKRYGASGVEVDVRLDDGSILQSLQTATSPAVTGAYGQFSLAQRYNGQLKMQGGIFFFYSFRGWLSNNVCRWLYNKLRHKIAI